MFQVVLINKKINFLQWRCLRLLKVDKLSSFEKLVEKEKSVTIHTRNLQILATKMSQVYRNISPSIFSDIFHRPDANFNLRINSEFAMSNVRSVFHRSESISCLRPKIWDIIPLELKEFTRAVAFKKGIKERKPKNDPFRLCKKYVFKLGLIAVTLWAFSTLYWCCSQDLLYLKFK